MINKRIVPYNWLRDGQPSVTMLNIGSKGLDKDQLNKIASSKYLMSFDMVPEKGKSYLHLITTGAGEFYGANNNGDYFNKTAIDFTAANGRTIRLSGGLNEHHNTFMKFGNVYREHNNSKKGAKPEGRIIKEAMNPEMHRGELIVELDNNKWANDLNKLANGEAVLFSMGCGVPYDICSFCLNKAATRNNYCSHLKYDMLQMDKEARQAFAINDIPHFHDISQVGTPAEKIAFGLRKVAKNGNISELEEVKHGLYIPIELMHKIASNTEAKRYALIHKLADMEKRIEAEGLMVPEETIAEACPCDGMPQDNKLVTRAKGEDFHKLLGALQENDVMLPPKTFIRIATGKPDDELPGLAEMPNAIKDIFSHLVENGNLEELVQDGSYYPSQTHPDRSTKDLGKSLAEQFSLGDDPLSSRVIKITIMRKEPRSLTKIAARCRPIVSTEARVLATEYAKYQLAFLANSTNNTLQNRVVLHNCS